MKIKVLPFILIPIFLTSVLFAEIGRASSNTDKKGIGQVEISGDYQVNVTYKLSETQPDHLESVHLDVSMPTGASDPNQILISMDEGETWLMCKLSGSYEWTCSFKPETAPNIEFIQNIRVLVS